MLPPLIKATAGSSVAVRASIDKLVLGSIPDIGFPGDIGLHGPHRYNWNQFVGSLKYTLWRLQERVVGRGPNSPQVPVIPDPLVPGQIDVAPAAPGPAAMTAARSPPPPMSWSAWCGRATASRAGCRWPDWRSLWWWRPPTC